MKRSLKRLFDKKKLTEEDRMVNVIAKFIKNNYDILEDISHKDIGTKYYIRDMWAGVILYYSKTQRTLYYRRDLAQDIFNFIPDNRLLQPDSELMGKVFEKLYKNKVRNVSGYQHTLVV
jgi:hypothetical protein